MLQFSRTPESTRSWVFLSEVLQQTLDLAANDYDLKKKYNFRGIQIDQEIESVLPKVFIVVVEVEQVILNLLRNAAQAMVSNPPERPAHLRIRLFREGAYLALSIRDNGPGMEDGIRRRIFEPFFTTMAPGAGTGLGLSVSFMIITQNHKGLLEVESAPGKGSCFTVRLPIEEGGGHA
jgi:signal transduction histidine kinase